MIPKVIHYCWFGGNPLPESAKKCINSWKKYCPDYEIIEWNESNFDVYKNQYCKEAYEARKWAFVSDFARFDIIYNYGGIYFDTDVELIRPIDNLIKQGAFMGTERYKPISVAPGLGIAAPKGLEIYKEILEFYKDRRFKFTANSYDTTTVVVHVTHILKRYGLKEMDVVQKVAGINIYPVDFLCPKNVDTGELRVTRNTYAIHHYDGSWLDVKGKVKINIKKFLIILCGEKIVGMIRSFLCK